MSEEELCPTGAEDFLPAVVLQDDVLLEKCGYTLIRTRDTIGDTKELLLLETLGTRYQAHDTLSVSSIGLGSSSKV